MNALTVTHQDVDTHVGLDHLDMGEGGGQHVRDRCALGNIEVTRFAPHPHDCDGTLIGEHALDKREVSLEEAGKILGHIAIKALDQPVDEYLLIKVEHALQEGQRFAGLCAPALAQGGDSHILSEEQAHGLDILQQSFGMGGFLGDARKRCIDLLVW